MPGSARGRPAIGVPTSIGREVVRVISTISLVFFAVFVIGCSTIGGIPSSSAALECYDLYFAPTFLRPTHFTMERHPDAYIMREHSYRGKGGYSPKKLSRSKSKRLSKEDWSRLIETIDDGGFWTDAVTDINEWRYLDAISIRFSGKRVHDEKEIRQYGEYSAFLYDLLDQLEQH